MPYSVTKAAQWQLVKCLATTVGPTIRVNTVLPGLLLTEWVRTGLAAEAIVSHFPMLTTFLGTQVLGGAHHVTQVRSSSEA